MKSQDFFIENDLGEMLINPELFSEDPAFQAWIRGSKESANLARRMVRKRLVRNAEEAVLALYEASKAHPPAEKLRIASVDLKGGNYLKPYSQLKKNDGEETVNTEQLRGFGVILHSVVESIWTQQFFEEEKERQQNAPVRQLELEFAGEDPKGSSPASPVRYRLFAETEKSKRPRRITKGFLRKLEHCWQPLAKTLGNEWVKNYTKLKARSLRNLFRMVSPFISENAEEILRKKQKEDNFQYFYTLTMMTLASAILHIGKLGHYGGLREIPILHRKYRFGGWRIDMLRIESINGEPPTERHISLINKLQKERFSSLNEVIRKLRAILNDVPIQWRIYELKFAVGDGITSRHVIQPGDINGVPLPKHGEQVKTYLALANLGRGLAKRHLEVWNNGSVKFKKAKILYFFPSRLPVEYDIEADGDEQRDVFFEAIQRHQGRAKFKSVVRERSNHLAKFVERSEKNGKLTFKNGKNDNGFHKEEKPLIDVADPHEELMQLIGRHRVFIGPYNIIEKVGDDTKVGGRKSPYRFHLSTFLEKMEEGMISTRGFSMERGGFVRCLFPWHWEGDTHPSMMVFMNRYYARCYVCGLWMPFDSSSIPENLHLNLEHARTARLHSLEDLEKIPPGFTNTMNLIHQVFQAFFHGGKGEEYIRTIRRLDSELAYQYGAGFCDEDATNVLLDLFDFEELVHCGLVNFSDALKETQGLYPLLKKRGRKIGEVVRDGGLPFMVMKNRVTFPLDFGEGRITSFYGRYASERCEKGRRHRKTLARHSGIPQGMFNGKLVGKNGGTISVFEAVLNALTAIQVGYDAGAIVGTFNYLALEYLKQFKGGVSIGFDQDAPGEKARRETEQWILQNDAQNINCDFMREFLTHHPKARDYKDLNAWWMHDGYGYDDY